MRPYQMGNPHTLDYVIKHHYETNLYYKVVKEPWKTDYLCFHGHESCIYEIHGLVLILLVRHENTVKNIHHH